MATSRGKTTVCWLKGTRKPSSSNQATPADGFLISLIVPRGGPQTIASRTFLAAAGASSNFFNFNFAIDAGPSPAISFPRTSLRFVGVRIPSLSTYKRPRSIKPGTRKSADFSVSAVTSFSVNGSSKIAQTSSTCNCHLLSASTARARLGAEDARTAKLATSGGTGVTRSGL